MLKERAWLFAKITLLCELGIWIGAHFAARWASARWGMPLKEQGEIGDLVVAIVAWTMIHRLIGLDRSWRTRPALEESWAVVRGGVGVFLALSLASLLPPYAEGGDHERGFLILYALTGTVAVLTFRRALRALLRHFRRSGWNTRAIVVVGDGALADGVAATIRANRQWGLRLLGFVRVNGGTPDGPILGHVKDLAEVVDKNVVDEVIFAVENARLGELEPALRQCEEVGVPTNVVLNFFPHSIFRPALSGLNGIPMLSFQSTQDASPLQRVLKRGFDVLVALVGLLVTAPILAVVAVLVKLDDGGPIFFVQERVGLNGRRFKMVKFRSMGVDAEARRKSLHGQNEADGPVFKIREDPRITRVGRWLRRTSVDELPQFWNVLRGEMSVVGPRPPLPAEVDRYERWQRRRLSVKPGLTCIWQVSGRSDVDFRRWMQMDMSYVDSWSLWLDLKLFALTIPAVLFGRGAR